MCALFCVSGEVMDLKNRSFVKTSVKHRAKKLDVVLRRLTGDTLTKDQRLPGQANKDCGKRVRMLLGKNCGMMAALVSSKTQGRGDNTVYLYLPESKEAMGDEMQEEDAKEA